MPSKRQSAVTSSKDKKPSKVATRDTAATPSESKAGPVAARTKFNARKRAAPEPPEIDELTRDKRVRLAGEGLLLLMNSPPQKAGTEGENMLVSLRKLKELKLKLADHVPRSMAAIFEGINHPDIIPSNAPVTAKLDALIAELEKRVLAGSSIIDDLRIIDIVEKVHRAGRYDNDPDGLSKDIRMRLDDAEYMVVRLTSVYLKNIIRQLNPFSGGGTDTDMADEIVGILLHLAKQGKDIKHEYRMIKLNYTRYFETRCHPPDPALDNGPDE